MREIGVALVAALAFPAMAGCLGAVPDDAGNPTGVPVAVQPGVDDPARFVVEVTGATAGSEPIAGATVVFFNATLEGDWAGFGGEEVDRAYMAPEDFPCDRSWSLAGSDRWQVLAVGETGPDGRVVGMLDPAAKDRMLSVAVGGVEGWTTEVDVGTWDAHDVVCDGDGGWPFDATDRREEVRLYRDRLDRTLDDAFPTSASVAALPDTGTAADRVATSAWQPHAPSFASGRDRNRKYLARLTSLDATLAWNNTATAYGDLYLRTGEERGPDRRQLPGSGASHETWTLDLANRSTRDLEAFVIGPASDRPVVAPGGLRYRVDLEAGFAGAPVVLPSPAEPPGDPQP